MEIKNEHDADQLGALIAESEAGGHTVKLSSLADLVRTIMCRDSLPRVPAVRKIIERLKADDCAGLAVYLTDPAGDFARAVPPEHVFRVGQPARPAYEQITPRRGFSSAPWGGSSGQAQFTVKKQAASTGCDEWRGVPGALSWLSEAWGSPKIAAEAMRTDLLARLAIPEDLALHLFDLGPEKSFWQSDPCAPACGVPSFVGAPAGFFPSLAMGQEAEGVPTAPAEASVGAEPVNVVQPVGSAWPHKKGDKWTEAEKSAMRSMRAAGMSDAEIARVAGCTRQVVGQQILSKTGARAEAATQGHLARLAA